MSEHVMCAQQTRKPICFMFISSLSLRGASILSIDQDQSVYIFQQPLGNDLIHSSCIVSSARVDGRERCTVIKTQASLYLQTQTN